MRMGLRKGRILRIRPGHLANASSGAGYMPFVIIWSVPASLIFGVMSSILLHFRGRRLLERTDSARTGLHEFVRYARRHTFVCLILAVVAGVPLFLHGLEAVYGDKAQYAAATVVFAVWPLGAWILSSLALTWLIVWRGARWTNLLIAAAVHILLLFAGIPLLMLVEAITGTGL